MGLLDVHRGDRLRLEMISVSGLELSGREED